MNKKNNIKRRKESITLTKDYVVEGEIIPIGTEIEVVRNKIIKEKRDLSKYGMKLHEQDMEPTIEGAKEYYYDKLISNPIKVDFGGQGASYSLEKEGYYALMYAIEEMLDNKGSYEWYPEEEFGADYSNVLMMTIPKKVMMESAQGRMGDYTEVREWAMERDKGRNYHWVDSAMEKKHYDVMQEAMEGGYAEAVYFNAEIISRSYELTEIDVESWD